MGILQEFQLPFRIFDYQWIFLLTHFIVEEGAYNFVVMQLART
jgi:hypothetical protein